MKCAVSMCEKDAAAQFLNVLVYGVPISFMVCKQHFEEMNTNRTHAQAAARERVASGGRY